jgi:PAS domain S-box-containing protein
METVPRDGFAADLLDQVPAAVTASDLDGTITHWNQSAERLFGWLRDEALGRDFRELLVPPTDVEAVNQTRARVLDGEVWEGEFPVRRKDGASIICLTTLSPIRDADERIAGVASVSVDVTERKRTDQLIAAQLGVTRVLAEARNLAEASPRIIRAICESLGWDFGAIWRVDVESGVIRCVDAWHDPASEVGEFEDVSRKAALPLGVGLPGRVWANRKPEWIPDVVKDANFPRAAVAARVGLHGGFGFPIRLGGQVLGVMEAQVLGVMEFLSQEIREPDEALMTTIAAMSSQIGQFIERKEAEEAVAQSVAQHRFLAEASTLLASSLDYEVTLEQLAALTVEPVGGRSLADWCVVHIKEEDGSVRQLAVAHVDPSKLALATQLGERYPADPHAQQGPWEVLRTGRSELYPEISDQFLTEVARDDEHLAILRSLGLRSTIVVPLVAGGKRLGAMTLVVSESARRYGQEDLTFAEDLAARAAMAVANARLFGERDEIARKLQESLLPPDLPPIPGLELASKYRAAGSGFEVGGDFYDVFPLSGGAWSLVIGDVCGKGPDAAGLTGLVRHTIRAAAMQERKPSRILGRLNDAVSQQRDDSVFCTVCLVRLKPGGSGARLTVCCGGHPLPFVLRADGSVESVGAPGTLLGIFDDPQLTDRAVDVGPGDTIVLYTDGVIEERAHGSVFGRERLAALLESCAGMDASAIAESIDRAVMGFQPGPPRDDIAILVGRIRP